MRPYVYPVLCLVLLGGRAAAQQQDPTEAIKEIVERVERELREIDRLLLDSTRPKDQSPSKLLQDTQGRSQRVVEGIDELIEQLEQMKQRSQSQQQQQQDQQQQDEQQQQQQDQQQGGQRNRRENQTPDFVDQGQRQQQQDQQQQAQNQPQRPDGPEQNPDDPGRNKPGTTPPDNGTEPGKPGTGSESWGELQPYFNAIKNRGSPPKVPEKFRAYWEAYLREQGKKK